MKVLTTTGLTKLIQLCKSAFVDKTDVVETQTVTLATVATSGSYNDLSNKPTIPTVNNATLTIQKNGTTVKTFTANASSNVTANITVPTNNNQLTNGAGYITSSALSGYATETWVGQQGFLTSTALNGYATETWVGQQGYITGITSTMVTNALGYTPYDSSNPNGYTSNVGTVTSVNNVSPVNGNVTLSIPSEVTETTVSNWGFTKNTGTVTSVNNTSPVNGNVTLSIPTVNNPTITLTQGGVTKGSFTLNQSTGDTIALDAGGGSVNTFDLFDHKWSDYQLNDQSWLRADTFSWQDGTVYSDAYDHLVADYNGGTSQTETVGSYTITYVLATDGHKITTDETTVANIYAESGVAWYYVLDTTNTRFKLPRENPAREELIKVVRAKGNGIALGITDGTTNYGEISTQYTASQQLYQGRNTSAYGSAVGTTGFGNGTSITSGTALGITTDSTKSGIISDMTDSTSVYKGNKYLYFYVGQFSQSATEQTAGLNSELFNDKVDLDGGNATFPHVTSMYEEDGILVVLWSNNYCEQSGFVNTTATTTTVNLKKEYTNTNYNISLTEKYTASAYPANVHTVNKGSFVVYVPTVNQDFYWKTCGFIA